MADAAPQPPFAVNDRVVYPNLGLCRVSGFETLTIAGQQVSFVTLKRETDGATVRVPPGKLTSAGVRRLAGKQEVADMFRFLKSDSDKATLDWKQRARTNTERMAQGGLIGLAEVVKGLQVLSELRPLPTKERELYDNARALLVSELAAALSCSPCDVEDAVDVALSPPGKERPRRTAEEFKRTADGDEDALGDDLLGLDGDLDGIPTDEPPPEGEAEGDGAGEEAPPKKPARSSKPTKAPKAAPRRPILSDEEVTMTMARAVALPAEPKKRGRPPGSTSKAKKQPKAKKPAAKAKPAKGKKGGRS
ncbi:MAG: transcriptional regulator [Deltaproteobacteria bacterium]|nr:transcriptional regulator [Deltaproteobacteria bacterium]